jgi:hypothetical protein
VGIDVWLVARAGARARARYQHSPMRSSRDFPFPSSLSAGIAPPNVEVLVDAIYSMH